MCLHLHIVQSLRRMLGPCKMQRCGRRGLHLQGFHERARSAKVWKTLGEIVNWWSVRFSDVWSKICLASSFIVFFECPGLQTRLSHKIGAKSRNWTPSNKKHRKGRELIDFQAGFSRKLVKCLILHESPRSWLKIGACSRLSQTCLQSAQKKIARGLPTAWPS